MDAARYAALFQAEAREHLAELDAALLALEDGLRSGAASSHAAHHVATLFRGMHTIKGMAAAMGYAPIERLAHALESRCEPLRSGEEALSHHALTLVFEGTDLLRAGVEQVAHGGTPDEAAVQALLARLQVDRATVFGDTTHASPFEAAATDEHATARAARTSGRHGALTDGLPEGANVRHVDVRLVPDCPLKGVRAMLVLAKLGQVGLVRATHPEQSRWQDDHFDGAFRVTLVSGAEDDAIVQAATSAGDVARVSVRTPAAALHGAPGAGALSAAPAMANGTVDGSAASRTVRIDAARLDTLLDLVGELVITRDRLLRALEGLDHPDRDVLRAARDTARLVGAMQDEVLQARLLPVAQVFDRFPRLVRDVARELGKDVAFVTEGREIELDRSLLDAIGDPILHLLRNALDHGIEDPATREAAGKPARGELVLRAARERATVVLQVQDDGRGIDRARVLRRAQEQGLLPAHATGIADEQLLPILAHPGFSTAQKVTTVSGRGVGVDVVNTRVRALGGQVELESIEGVGTVVTLRLPATLAITRALIVKVGSHTFALPAAHVEEALEYHETMCVHHAGAATVTIRDEVVPLVALDERFALPRSSHGGSTEAVTAPDATDRHLAVVEAGGRRAALLVDALVAQQDIVVKPLDVVRGAAPWFSGATVLGDGSPALIVDVASVM